MRISDSMKYRVYQQNLARVNQQMLDVQTQIATEKSINTPSDDPTKYAADVKYDAEISSLEQINENLENLVTLASMYDTCFTSISDYLATIEEFAVNTETMDEDLLSTTSDQISDIIEALVGIANTKLGNTYIFGGQQTDTAPFQLNIDYSVTYTVDEDEEEPNEISAGTYQTIEYGVSGKETFYSSSKIAYADVDNTYTGDIYSTTDSFVYVIDDTNHTINVNGTELVLASGTYSGSEFAEEIENTLESAVGEGCTVVFDSTTRKFTMSNSTGSDVSIDWTTSTSADTLGFESNITAIESGGTIESDFDTGKKSFLVQIEVDDSTGAVTYQYSTDGGANWSDDIAASTGGAGETADITIGDTDYTNNTLYVNGTEVTITNGTYTGSELAEEIETQIETQAGIDCTVSYDTSTRKFTITNNTDDSVVINWSDSTAAGVLGFENSDSVVSSGTNDESDYDAGMFIDGSGVVTTENNGIKLAFSTDATDSFADGDTFHVADLSVFDLLTNLKNACDAGNTEWISDNAGYVEDAIDLITNAASVVAYQGTQAEEIISSNETKIASIQDIQSNLVDADTATLGVELTALTTTYETLLAAMSKSFSVNILDYL